MQNFFIKQNSILPLIAVDLIKDGRHDYNHFFENIQDASITFTMFNVENGNIKISNEPCYIKLKEGDCCVEEYTIYYNWRKRDTREKGRYRGVFEITFKGHISSPGVYYPSGNLIMPIREEIEIIIL